MSEVEPRRELTVTIPEAPGTAVSALLLRPRQPRSLLVLAHGFGAGMEHPFLSTLAQALADRGIATLRYQFPYMERGSRRPDSVQLLRATVAAATRRGREILDRAGGGLPLLAGGKSLGGRMTSQAAAKDLLPPVAGLVFYGFPLHPAGKPAIDRGGHLASVSTPMLFLQGTRDRLADLELFKTVLDPLEPARLHVVDDADHGFRVRKRSGRTDEEVMAELAEATRRFAGELT